MPSAPPPPFSLKCPPPSGLRAPLRPTRAPAGAAASSRTGGCAAPSPRAAAPLTSEGAQEWRATLKTLGAGGSLPFRELAAAEAARLAGEGFEPGQLRARLAHLVAVLEIDEAWQPGRVSDGQLRRMQLAVKLMAPRPLVLLDEVSVDLDVTARDALLAFLAAESRAGGVTVVYCTHILDGLAGWASHHLHLTRGAAAVCAPMDASMAQHAPAGAANESALGGGSRLYLYVQGLLWGETAASAGGTAAEVHPPPAESLGIRRGTPLVGGEWLQER